MSERKISLELYNSVEKYIKENYIEESFVLKQDCMTLGEFTFKESSPEPKSKHSSLKQGIFNRNCKNAEEYDYSDCMEVCEDSDFTSNPIPVKSSSLEEELENLDEGFSETLLRKIDEKGISDSECYKKAGVDRRLFSKIRTNAEYRPSKTTAIAFALALELSLEETDDLLMKAGYILSSSSKFDTIIKYFITNNSFDIMTINNTLFEFDQPLIGM